MRWMYIEESQERVAEFDTIINQAELQIKRLRRQVALFDAIGADVNKPIALYVQQINAARLRQRDTLAELDQLKGLHLLSIALNKAQKLRFMLRGMDKTRSHRTEQEARAIYVCSPAQLRKECAKTIKLLWRTRKGVTCARQADDYTYSRYLSHLILLRAVRTVRKQLKQNKAQQKAAVRQYCLLKAWAVYAGIEWFAPTHDFSSVIYTHGRVMHNATGTTALNATARGQSNGVPRPLYKPELIENSADDLKHGLPKAEKTIVIGKIIRRKIKVNRLD